MLSDNTEHIWILSSRQLEAEVCLSVTQILTFLDGLKLLLSLLYLWKTVKKEKELQKNSRSNMN